MLRRKTLAQQLRAQAQNIGNANPGEAEQRRLNEERAARRAAAAAQAERTRQQAEAARRAEEQARQQAQTAARSAAQARIEAQNALRTARDPILAQSAGRTTAKPRGNKGFTRANGILVDATSTSVGASNTTRMVTANNAAPSSATAVSSFRSPANNPQIL